jgi:hypothetical protein
MGFVRYPARKVTGTMSTTTNTRVELDHPYWGAGLVAVLLSFGILAYSLGVLARCGHGTGLCFDTATHASGDAGIVAFVVVLIIGVALMVTSGTASISTRSRTREPPAPVVTNVITPAAAPAPAVTNVYPQAPSAPTAVVVTSQP